VSTTLARNLKTVRDRIQVALARSDTPVRDIRLVVVTKTVGSDPVELLASEGVTDIGENRVQQAFAKHEQLGHGPYVWHMIGHLQTNKVRRALEVFDRIDSVDSLKLARAISSEAERLGRTVPVLVEVNAGGEEQKYGVQPEKAPELIARVAELSNIAVEGLMTMAPLTDDEERIRPAFRRLRELSRRSDAVHIPGVAMHELSMGMSNDFEIAVEEGSTMVRVGTAIFQDVS